MVILIFLQLSVLKLAIQKLSKIPLSDNRSSDLPYSREVLPHALEEECYKEGQEESGYALLRLTT
jgi:hypothetical protein